MTPKKNKMDTPSISSDEFYSLNKIKILNEIQKEVLKWAKGRFWIIVVVVTVINIFGIKSIIDSVLHKNILATDKATYIADETRVKLSDVNELVGELKKKTQDLKESLDDIEDSQRELSSFSINLGIFQKQLKEVSDYLSSSDKDFAWFKEKREEEMKLKDSEVQYLKDNYKYKILINFTKSAQPTSKIIAEKLINKGFKVKVEELHLNKKDEISENVLEYAPISELKIDQIQNIIKELIPITLKMGDLLNSEYHIKIIITDTFLR
jgi:hypothetical protein